MSGRKTARGLTRAALIASPLVLVPLAVPATADAAVPARRPPCGPPVLEVAQSWLFRVGAQADKAAAARSGPFDVSANHRQVPVELAWQGRSCVGIDHYDLYRYSPVGWTLQPVLTHTRQTRLATLHTDIHYAIGPITRELYATYKLVATDRLGRSTVVDQVRRSPVSYEQENGTTYANGGVFTAKPVAGPGWRTQRGADFDGGTVLATSRRGAQVRIPVTTSHPMQLALEMTTGPRTGAVTVLIDGRRAGVVDTRATTARSRVLVAQYRLAAGRHTVTLVNLAPRHREVVQLDGVFVSD